MSGHSVLGIINKNLLNWSVLLYYSLKINKCSNLTIKPGFLGSIWVLLWDKQMLRWFRASKCASLTGMNQKMCPYPCEIPLLGPVTVSTKPSGFTVNYTVPGFVYYCHQEICSCSQILAKLPERDTDLWWIFYIKCGIVPSNTPDRLKSISSFCLHFGQQPIRDKRNKQTWYV